MVLGFRGAKKHRYLRCFLQVSQQKSENATYLTIFWSLQDSEKTAGVTTKNNDNDHDHDHNHNHNHNNLNLNLSLNHNHNHNNNKKTNNKQQTTTEQAGDTLDNNSNPWGIPGAQSPQKKKTYIFIWGK